MIMRPDTCLFDIWLCVLDMIFYDLKKETFFSASSFAFVQDVFTEPEMNSEFENVIVPEKEEYSSSDHVVYFDKSNAEEVPRILKESLRYIEKGSVKSFLSFSETMKRN